MRKFHLITQRHENDCGIACLQMIARYYHRPYGHALLLSKVKMTARGTSLANLMDGAQRIGLHSVAVKLTLRELVRIKSPCIVHLKKRHFVVVVKIHRTGIDIADPAGECYTLSEYRFKKKWLVNNCLGYALLIGSAHNNPHKKGIKFLCLSTIFSLIICQCTWINYI